MRASAPAAGALAAMAATSSAAGDMAETAATAAMASAGAGAASARVTFSVIVPLYNKAPLIAATLASALADRSRIHEIIVVDDGSTDSSAAVVASLDDPLVRLIRQDNGGVSRARNRGIAEARGEWLAFLDADDLWAPGYLARLEALAIAFPDCAMLATGYRTDEDGEAAHRHMLEHPQADSLLRDEALRIDDYLAATAGGQICCTISTAVRRAFVLSHDLRFPEGEHLGEDLDFFTRVAEHTPLAYCAEPLAIYVQSNQVSRLSETRAPQFVPAFLDRLEARLRAGDVPGARRDSAIQYLTTKLETVLLAAIRDGRRGMALAILARPVMLTRRRRWLALLTCATLPAGWIGRVRQWRRRLAPRQGGAGLRLQQWRGRLGITAPAAPQPVRKGLATSR